ncbi:hypothetical protein Patl1_00641 [Pistacia atlantica]|uniref:Uncharacterized protein n=1 Tax=Pistacia atlantica TaxID=434234 RepID=A0ACC1CCN2_9ROSI|nr:hypothetical protein Patl1_00641 [Pistacia atlantica]
MSILLPELGMQHRTCVVVAITGHTIFINQLRYLIASHTTDYQHPMLFFNTLAVIVLVIAKFPNMHKVRIFGINADK